MFNRSLFFELAVLALATVAAVITVASAKTADSCNPDSKIGILPVMASPKQADRRLPAERAHTKFRHNQKKRGEKSCPTRFVP